MVHRVREKKGKKWAAEMVSLATERLSPPPTIGGGGIPFSPVGAAAVAESPQMTDV
jgi:hypothetical protein